MDPTTGNALRGSAMSWGDLFHAGLETWYSTRDGEKALRTMIDLPFEDPYEDYRTREKALSMFIDYHNHYGLDPQWEILFTETPFEILTPDGFKWGGKIDLLVRWNGKLWLVDHKTTSMFGPTYFDQFFPDTQTAGYIWALSQLHGEPIYGAIINTIVVHKVDQKKPEDKFKRKWFPYEPWHIEEWKVQAESTYREIEHCINTGVFRPRWQNCTTKYGRCSWYEHCRLDPENRPRFLQNETLPNTWSFKNVREKEG